MLDYQRLVAPARHGGVLVAPEPFACADLVRQNASQLDSSEIQIAQIPLRLLRTQTRRRLGITQHQPLIVLGHQPDFIHAGVWAKNVFAFRLARFLQGAAVNLVVDCDAPKRLSIRVPAEHKGRWASHDVQMGQVHGGHSYEQAGALGHSKIERVRSELAGLRGDSYAASMLPVFLNGMSASLPTDWVGQVVAGRRAVEAEFEIKLKDVRISQAWWSPLGCHVLLNCERFARAYNTALKKYREQNKVRTANRPIPDLVVEEDRIELPFWLHRKGEPRRRAFAKIQRGGVTLMAASEQVFALNDRRIESVDDLVALVEKESGWQLRPRALMTTMWARLFLADLFVHGIGGAKYDRISDAIIEDFFGLPAPAIACVTATLYLDDSCGRKVESAGLEREVRDATWNPQRHVLGGQTDGVADLIRERQRAAELATKLARDDHEARHEVFLAVRRLNEEIHAARPELLAGLHSRLVGARHEQANRRVLCDREYFFAMHARRNLELLMGAFPSL